MGGAGSRCALPLVRATSVTSCIGEASAKEATGNVFIISHTSVARVAVDGSGVQACGVRSSTRKDAGASFLFRDARPWSVDRFIFLRKAPVRAILSLPLQGRVDAPRGRPVDNFGLVLHCVH